ncbi:hypothetical protein FJU30_04925 [Affinibrenneria salicis]|uniref:Uncharacterized protein n=1 Tax=Affinibrenneria salicis TaxID=2590031 RepID=A0A5J5G3P5_9GAMM|nr:hypothetical protein [Affinibrenneria salicis]KAA9001638.1 hypothetical protein FJU30_04925 [Affinibrenneria salicis]
MSKQKKPTGVHSSILVDVNGVHREFVDFPDSKSEIELFIAQAFCEGKPNLNPQIKRYGKCNLKHQPENSIDFQIETEKKGTKWLELAEFAPLNEFGGKYENTPNEWKVEDLTSLFLELIYKKNSKQYGDGVILLIYNTHDSLFIPPPIIRHARNILISMKPSFDAIYFTSVHSSVDAAAWQVWPNDIHDEGPIASKGFIHIGITDIDKNK